MNDANNAVGGAGAGAGSDFEADAERDRDRDRVFAAVFDASEGGGDGGNGAESPCSAEAIVRGLERGLGVERLVEAMSGAVWAVVRAYTLGQAPTAVAAIAEKCRRARPHDVELYLVTYVRAYVELVAEHQARSAHALVRAVVPLACEVDDDDGGGGGGGGEDDATKFVARHAARAIAHVVDARVQREASEWIDAHAAHVLADARAALARRQHGYALRRRV